MCHCLNLALIYASVIVSNNDTCCYFHEWDSKIPQLRAVIFRKNPFPLVIACIFALLNYLQEEYKF